MKPAPDNQEVGGFELRQVRGTYQVRFLNLDGEIMLTDVKDITRTGVKRVSDGTEWSKLSTARSKSGADKLVRRFLQGEILDK